MTDLDQDGYELYKEWAFCMDSDGQVTYSILGNNVTVVRRPTLHKPVLRRITVPFSGVEFNVCAMRVAHLCHARLRWFVATYPPDRQPEPKRIPSSTQTTPKKSGVLSDVSGGYGDMEDNPLYPGVLGGSIWDTHNTHWVEVKPTRATRNFPVAMVPTSDPNAICVVTYTFQVQHITEPDEGHWLPDFSFGVPTNGSIVMYSQLDLSPFWPAPTEDHASTSYTNTLNIGADARLLERTHPLQEGEFVWPGVGNTTPPVP
jgi:hypothetical protein